MIAISVSPETKTKYYTMKKHERQTSSSCWQQSNYKSEDHEDGYKRCSGHRKLQ